MSHHRRDGLHAQMGEDWNSAMLPRPLPYCRIFGEDPMKILPCVLSDGTRLGFLA